MSTKAIRSKILLLLLPIAPVFMSGAKAQNIQATYLNYAEKIYQRFSEIQNGDIRFETKVLQAGNLREIADRPLNTMMIRPDFRISLASKGAELEFSRPNSKELNLVLADTTQSITPDMVKAGGNFRIIEVTSHFRSKVTRHMTLELCSKADDFCFLVDPTMSYLETVVYAFNESTMMMDEALANASSHSSLAGEEISGSKATSCRRGGDNVFLADLPFTRGDVFVGGVMGTAKGFNYTFSCSLSGGKCNIASSATVPNSTFHYFGIPILNPWFAKCSKLDMREAKWYSGRTQYSRAVAITGCGVKQGGLPVRFSYAHTGSGSRLNFELDTNASSLYQRGALFQRNCAYVE